MRDNEVQRAGRRARRGRISRRRAVRDLRLQIL